MKTDQDPLGILGTTVDDKYRIVELAGIGGFSAVYRAEHLVWREPVALKFFTLLRDAGETVREHLLEDFIQEGKLMSQLSSRCAAIVQARDVGRLALEEGRWIPFMVLEWFDGASLEQVLAEEVRNERPPRSLSEAMVLLEPVAEALDVAHQRSIAHRDLKPANIVLAGDARATDVPVKVLDFGIAKVMADHQDLRDQLTRTGQQMSAFTPTYGAPEQFSRTYGATGPWTDVYAMALILVELVRGGKSALAGGTLFELGAASCHAEQRPTPGHWNVDLGEEIEAVFQRAILEPAS
ncbi:MAG: serine/threonine protein kinase [Deltaproteobacteria bacterium]|nr:serine/threonine protein kinase [Deltaproteobacteria bacterium]